MTSKTKIHTLNLINGSAVTALSCVRDSKTFDNPLDVLNAGAIAAVILKKLPALKDSKAQPQALGLRKKDAEGKDAPMTNDEVDAWFVTPLALRLTELMRDTLKKAVEKHIKEGTITASEASSLLITELGLGAAVDIDALLVDESEAAPSDSAPTA
jgi:hypothetical protein